MDVSPFCVWDLPKIGAMTNLGDKGGHYCFYPIIYQKTKRNEARDGVLQVPLLIRFAFDFNGPLALSSFEEIGLISLKNYVPNQTKTLLFANCKKNGDNEPEVLVIHDTKN